MKLFSCKYVPLVTGLCGVAGLLARTALELFCIDEKGLYMTGHPLYLLLLAISILLPVWLFVAIKSAPSLPGDRQNPPAIVALAGTIVAAAGILVTDSYELFLSFQDFYLHQNSVAQSTLIISAICFVLGLLAAIALILAGIVQRKGKPVHYAFHGVLVVYLLIHPLSQYRMWSSDPQFLHYGFHLLASVCLLLAAYHRTALDAGKSGIRRFGFFSQIALFFCCVSINGDSWLFYLTMALWLATNSGRLYLEEASDVSA